MYNIVYCSMQGETREINEDALLTNHTLLKGCGTTQVQTPYLLAVVADGIGGYARGELASSSVLESLRESQPKNANELIIALIDARKKLDEIAHREKCELGTALAGVLHLNNRFFIFNVGDCRVYKITAAKELVLLTKDHTLINQLKKYNIKNRALEKQKNILTSAIIGGVESEDFEIFHDTFVLDKGEKLLICSDGFWSPFESEISQMVSKRDVIKFVKKKIKLKDMKDDYSFILIKEDNLLGFFHKMKTKFFNYSFFRYTL